MRTKAFVMTAKHHRWTAEAAHWYEFLRLFDQRTH